jgi:hypothetical protein
MYKGWMLITANPALQSLAGFGDSDRQRFAQLVAARLAREFGVMASRAALRSHEVLATLTSDTTRVLGDRDAFALLVPWAAPDGNAEEYVAAIGSVEDATNRSGLLDALWRYGREAGHPVQLAVAPTEFAELARLHPSLWTSAVFIRTEPRLSEPNPGIRLACDEDASFVRELLALATARGFAASPAGGATRALVEGVAAQLLAEVRGPTGISVIAAEGGQRLGHGSGVVRGWDEYGEDCLVELLDVFVTPSARSGIGTLIERCFLAESLRRGATSVEGHITVTNDPKLVPTLLANLAAKGWMEHRRLVQLGADAAFA